MSGLALAPTTVAHSGISVSDAFAVAASVVAVVAAAYGLLAFIRRTWRATIGSRRYQQRTLNKLACGQHRDYALALLGGPVFQESVSSSMFGPFEVLRFWMGHCWASVAFRGESVMAFSITAIRSSFKFNTLTLASAMLRLRLGRSHFSEAGAPIGEESFIGARRIFYRELHYFGNPGNYQFYLLSRNDAVRSAWREASTEPEWRSGPFRHSDDDEHHVPGADQPADDWRPGFRSAAKPNTLSVVGGNVSNHAEAVWIGQNVEINADVIRLFHPDGKLSYRERNWAWRNSRKRNTSTP
jgi:hypothetical protein